MSRTAADMNQLVVKRMIAAVNKITGESKMKLCDISYVKYQLLKKHDRYELLNMTDAEFNDKVMDVISGGS